MRDGSPPVSLDWLAAGGWIGVWETVASIAPTDRRSRVAIGEFARGPLDVQRRKDGRLPAWRRDHEADKEPVDDPALDERINERPWSFHLACALRRHAQ